MIKVRRVQNDKEGKPIYPVTAVSVYRNRGDKSRYETVRFDEKKSVFPVDAETAYALFTEKSAIGAFEIDPKSIARLKEVGKLKLEEAPLVHVLQELDILPDEDDVEETPANVPAPPPAPEKASPKTSKADKPAESTGEVK